MKKDLVKLLKEKRFVVGCPTIVKFKRKDGSIAKIKATKGEYVVKWKDIRKIL